ncbi:MAG: ABC transporter substrate-binding protein [Mycobacterium sp.]|nr:ABC transporter substrate-binding protein [Mycobacterium sp.]
MRIARCRFAVAVLTVAMVGVSCGNSNASQCQGVPSDPKSLAVASTSYSESKVLAEIYVQVLQVNGFKVSRHYGISSRENYIPALRDGAVSLIPEYIGNLLVYLDPTATATTLDAILRALKRRLPADLRLLTPSPASDTDTVTVTDQTAKKWHLRTIGDLAPHSAEVKFAAPPEFAIRSQGLPGLKEKYGLDISPDNFVGVTAGADRIVTKLVDGTVQAANVFSTNPAIPQNNLVILRDDKHNFLAQNLVPLVNSRKMSDDLKTVLNAVSAKLTTAALIALNTAVSGHAGVDPREAVQDWLRENGLDKSVLS